MNCPICQKPNHFILYIKDYRVFECLYCSHRATRPKDSSNHVIQVYSDDYFFRGGAGYPNYLDESVELRRHGRCYGKKLSKYFKKPGRVLDVGTAAGFILQGLIDRGWEGHGIEPNARMATFGRDVLGLNIQTRTIEDFIPEKSFDLICFIQVLAHLIDPWKVVRKAHDMLSPQGYILVETWNWRSLTARLFGSYWHEYNVPSVLHWFSRKSLASLFSQFKFQLVTTGRPQKFLNAKHAKSILQCNFNGHPIAQVSRYLQSFIPDTISIPYPLEDVFWALFQRKDHE